MTPEEQLQLADAMADSLRDPAADVRKEAFHCLIGLGLDGLSRIIDVLDDSGGTLVCKIEAANALGQAFSEGKVDRSKMVRSAIQALESCLTRENDALCEAAIDSLGEIGPQAIASKAKLLNLLDAKKDHPRLRVHIGAALLKISPVHS